MRWGGIFDYDQRKEKIAELEHQAQDPQFWDDPDKAQDLMKQLNSEKAWVAVWDDLNEHKQNLQLFKEIIDEGDESVKEDLQKEASELIKKVEEAEFKNMLSSDDDRRDAIITINPGAGGTESQDWAQMLYRMYVRYGEKKGFQVSTLEYQDGDVAGIKSATLEIKGEFAYGYLKAENGVHRLVRISPFDSNARRHTSFCSVFVTPVIDDTIDVELNQDDIEMQRFHAGGKEPERRAVSEVDLMLGWHNRTTDVLVYPTLFCKLHDFIKK